MSIRPSWNWRSFKNIQNTWKIEEDFDPGHVSPLESLLESILNMFENIFRSKHNLNNELFFILHLKKHAVLAYSNSLEKAMDSTLPC